MKRRAWLAAGVAVAAAATGAGIALRRTRGGDAAAVDALWGMGFEQPDGGRLAMAGMRGRPLLLNFWATWCPPCVKEMPLLDRFYRQRRDQGWRVVGLAVDTLAPVREYLARLPMSFPIGLAGLGGVELTRSFGNASGALPFTLIIDGGGRVFDRHLGALEPDDLDRWSRILA